MPLSRAKLNVLLAVLLLVTAGRVVMIEWTKGPLELHGSLRGRDFQVFYLAGRLIANGEADRLYDHKRLQELQQTLAPIDPERNPPYFLFYPPIAPWLVSPLARLPYGQAVAIWWALQAACFLTTAFLLRKEIAVDADWQLTVWLALAAFHPIWASVIAGQLSPLLLLVLASGLCLQRRGCAGWSGLALSLLAMKPHFYAGALVWVLLRRDWRGAAAMIAGAALQIAAISTTIGLGLFAAYVRYLPVCANISLIFKFTPSAEHGLSGSLQNLLATFGVPSVAGKSIGGILQVLVAAWAGWMLYRVASFGQSAENGDANLPREQTCAILFMLLLVPHVLTYDLVFLAVPLVYLWSSANWRLAAAIYLATSVFAEPLYDAIGFSLLPIVLMTALWRITAQGPGFRNWTSSGEFRERGRS
jgi:hypothetical protein